MSQWNNIYNKNSSTSPSGLSTPLIVTGSGAVGDILTITSTSPTTAEFAAPAVPPSDTLANVLIAGNNSGANNIVMGAATNVVFTDGVRIGNNGNTVGTTVINGICIGDSTTQCGANFGIAVGSGARANTNADNIAIGSNSTASGTASIAIGYQSNAQAINTTAIGYNTTGTGPSATVVGSSATNGSGSNNTIIGAAAKVSGTGFGSTVMGQGADGGSGGNNTVIGRNALALTTSANCVISGTSAYVTAASSNAIVIGAFSGTNVAVTDTISIGTQSFVDANKCVKIGKGANGSGGFNTCIGDTISINGTSNSCLVIGQNMTVPTGVTGSIFLGCAQTITGTPTNTICIGYLNTINAASATVVGPGAAGQVDFVTSIGRSCNVGATGAGGTAVGNAANSGTGIGNTAFGDTATAGAGTYNTVVGLSSSTVGSTARNTCIGYNSRVTNAAASDCVVLGAASVVSGAFTNVICLGANVTGGASNSIYTPTTLAASAAGTAVSWDASGRLHPNTSSIRYKQNVQELEIPTEDVLQIVPKIYNFKKGHCGCADSECDGLTCGREEVGFIAEDMEKLIPEICVYSKDEEGNKRVESIQYDRLSLFLIPILKQHADQISSLMRRIEELEATKA